MERDESIVTQEEWRTPQGYFKRLRNGAMNGGNRFSLRYIFLCLEKLIEELEKELGKYPNLKELRKELKTMLDLIIEEATSLKEVIVMGEQDEILQVVWDRMTVGEREQLLADLDKAGADTRGWENHKKVARRSKCRGALGALREALIIALDGERFSVEKYVERCKKIALKAKELC